VEGVRVKHQLLRLIGAMSAALAAALLSVAGLEAWLRLTVPASSNDSIYRYTLETKRYKVMKPSASVVAWGVPLRTNDLGFRDDAPSIPAKQPGEFRIIVLGSSFTVSAGVDFPDIYTSRLERRLRRAHPKVQVINLAVGGYHPIQQALVLEEVGLALQPDLVLVGLFPSNDFSLDIYEDNRRIALSGAQPKLPASAWYEHSYVYRAWGGRIVSKVAGLMRRGAQAADPGKGRREWDAATAALKSIAATAGEHRLPLVLAVLPQNFNFASQAELHGRVERFCRQEKLVCVDMLDEFVKRQWREAELRLNPLDAHPNAKYHAVVADALARVLAPLLPPPGPEAEPLIRARVN
jgi:hypothetical protein